MELVSIIVPIYNAEATIKKCVLSLVKQSYENLEIILLNDGSKDKTEEIIKQIKDERIKYIKKENTGIGDTRNLGIREAKGTYLMFVDSDDYIEENCVLKLMEKATRDDCDLVIGNYYLDLKEEQKEIKIKSFKDTDIKSNPNLLLDINLGPCNKLYKKDLALDNEFLVGIKYEDAPFVVEALLKAKKIGKVEDYLFHYVMKQSGETITRDERILDILKVCKIIEAKLDKYKYSLKTDMLVKILWYYIKTSRYIKDKRLREKLIEEIFSYLNSVDKNWRKCAYLKQENFLKRIIASHKWLVKKI